MNLKLGVWLVLISLFACKSETTNAPSTALAPSAPTALTVDGMIAKVTRSVNNIQTTGSIMSNEEVDIRSEISGKIKGLYFKEGSFVNKGQLLVKLEDDDLQAQWNKLDIEIQLAQSQEVRQKKLLASAAITEEAYENTMMSVKILKANQDIIKAALQKTKIYAPFSGIIGLRNVSVGTFLSPTQIVATIQDIQPLKLEFSIPEKYNHLVLPGKSIQFTVSNVSRPLSAIIYAKEPKIDPITRTSTIRATFNNPDKNIFPGSFASITIPVGKQTDVILIPSQAYIPKQDGASVFVKKNGVVAHIDVTAGDRTERSIEILEGLMDGDTVITTGILQLKPGMSVEVNTVEAILSH